jgi:hypothetical protein
VAVTGIRDRTGPPRCSLSLILPLPLSLPLGSEPPVAVPGIRQSPDDASHGAVGILPAVRSLLRRLVVHARAGSPRHQESTATVPGFRDRTGPVLPLSQSLTLPLELPLPLQPASEDLHDPPHLRHDSPAS